ncbi:hypothetical protein PLESTF_000629900 [Pleodorina starrii]|nr:hypothetical protein PLESTF_000629900 [Pleodorina starrii]
MTPCRPLTVYWLVRVTSAPPAGSSKPQVLWAGTEWVKAHDPTNPICPDSPTNWGYTRFAAWYCPCNPTPPPPPRLNAPPAPPPSCADDRYLLSRDGVYTDTIVADAWVGWTSMFASPSVLTTDVTWHLHMASGVRPGHPVWAFNWTQTYAAIPYLAVIHETVFNELYAGPSVRCDPPTGGLSQAIHTYAVTNQTTGIGILEFLQGDLAALLRPCQPLTLYLLASIQDFDNLASPVFAAADWVQAHDPDSPVCPNSNMSWGYTKFELTHCPCERPPPASAPPPPASPPPPPPASPPPPPVSPLPSNNDVLVDEFPFSASCRTTRDASYSPYRLTSLMGPYNATAATATYCFVVSARGGGGAAGVEASGPCADMGLNKVEFIVNHACVAESPRALRAVTVNDEKTSAFFDTRTWRGQLYGIMAISKLADLFPGVPSGGLRVCLRLSQASACGSPAGLCYGGRSCVYSLFNADRSCCPTSQVPL